MSVGYEILATRAVLNAYELLGSAAFARLLALLEGAWHGEASSFNAAMLSSIGFFLHMARISVPAAKLSVWPASF